MRHNQNEFDSSNNMHIKNLNVEFVNGLHWNTFKDSAFKVGQTNTISGN